MSDNHEQQPNSQELAALELYHQLLNLSPDNGDRALMVTLRLPNGRYVGDLWLSTNDVNDLTDASVGLAAVREHVEASPLSIDERDINADKLGAEAEAFLKNGGQL